MLSRLLLNPLAPGSSSLHNVGAMSWALTCILSKYRLPEISPQNMYASLPLDLSLVYRSNQSRAQHTSLSSFLISGLFGRSKGLLTYRFWYVRSFKAWQALMPTGDYITLTRSSTSHRCRRHRRFSSTSWLYRLHRCRCHR